MKTSQITLLSVLGGLAGIIVIMVSLSGMAFSGSDRDAGNIKGGAFDTSELRDFNEVEVEGNWRVNLTQGDDWRVELSYPEDYEGVIKAYVSGNELKLRRHSSGRWWNSDDSAVVADIVMPELKGLDIAGGGKLELSGFTGNELEVAVAGAVKLQGLDGQYEQLKLAVAGASDIDFQGVRVNEAKVELAGASNVTLAMNGGELSGSMAGAGSIQYYGSVSKQDVDIMGVGRINRLD